MIERMEERQRRGRTLTLISLVIGIATLFAVVGIGLLNYFG